MGFSFGKPLFTNNPTIGIVTRVMGKQEKDGYQPPQNGGRDRVQYGSSASKGRETGNIARRSMRRTHQSGKRTPRGK